MIDPPAYGRPGDAGVERPARDPEPIIGQDDIETTLAPADTGRAYPVGTILGSYRLLQQIGAGGMGRVFVAEHVRLGRKVALKVLRSEYSGNIEAVKRFFAEARAVNCINHENIIEVSDFIENPNGASFYIMELLRGTELRMLQDQEGVLPLPRALNIALQVCRGVGAAHQAGVIHRDLKPDNIFLIQRDGRRHFVKLLDFGVAKLNNSTLDAASTFKTSAGIVVGTPDYMAPEQALGHTVDHRCDVYSLGVILFEMVAGRRPFVARSAREVMVQHMTAEPPRPSTLNPAHGVPVELENLILDCLRKEPHERPATIRDVEQRLQLILDDFIMGRGTLARGTTGLRLDPRSRLRERWLAAAGMTLLLVCAGLFAWSQGYRPDFPVAQAGGLAKALRKAAGVGKSPPRTPALVAATPERDPAVATKLDKMTVEALPVSRTLAPNPPAHGPVGRAADPAGAAGSTAAPGASERAARSLPPTARRKPVKLDRDSVLDPFE
jgi:hypothetical protein